jgi:hypothetical protein
MPRLITCVDQNPVEEPILDSQAYWVRLPDGSRLRDGNGKLLAFRSRENAIAESKAVNAFLKENGKPALAVAVPPEPHDYAKHRAVVAEAHQHVSDLKEHAAKQKQAA